MTEYAAARGVTPTAVAAAIKSGRLVKAIVQDGKRIKIDPEIADEEWRANTRSGKGPAPQPIASGAAIPIDAADYSASRAKREAYLAELARLEYEEAEGQLVPAEEVRKQAFSAARQIRDAMMNLPDRVSAELAAIDDQFEVHKRLTAELRRILETALTEDE